MQPGCSKGLWVGLEQGRRAWLCESLKAGICGKHAAVNGRMAALDACCVEEARLAANQSAAWKAEFGQAIEATGRDATGPIANALTALK